MDRHCLSFAVPVVLAPAFLVVIPEGDLLLLLSSLPPATKARVPHPSRTLRWVGCRPFTSHLAVALLPLFLSVAFLLVIPAGDLLSRLSIILLVHQQIVLSTEAAHAFVSRAAEKSASLPDFHPASAAPRLLLLPFLLSSPQRICFFFCHFLPKNRMSSPPHPPNGTKPNNHAPFEIFPIWHVPASNRVSLK
jgi:hypothetical protein